MSDNVNLIENFIIKIKADISNEFDGFIGVNTPVTNILPPNDIPDVKMNIYPLNEMKNIYQEGNEKKCIFNKIIEPTLLKSERRLEDFFYFKNILKDFKKISEGEIFEFDLGNENIEWKKNWNGKGKDIVGKYILNGNKEYTIKYKKKNNKTNIILSKQLIDKINEECKENGQQEIINLTDIIFFGEKAKKLIGIPLSFFTTPTVLLIIKNNDYKDVKSLVSNIQETIIEHLYNYINLRIISKASDFIEASNKEEFINKFILELSEVLLPVYYKFKSKTEKVKMFETWISENENEEQNLEKVIIKLCNKRNEKLDEIIFYLKNYKLSRDKAAGANSAEWLSEKKGYRTTKEYAVVFIEKLFTLLYTQWEDKMQMKSLALKNAVGTIISRGMAHTDSSHVMLDIEKNNNVCAGDKISDTFRLYNKYLRNNLEYTADVSGGLGSQSKYEFGIVEVFDEFEEYFDSFLSTGLVDGNLANNQKTCSFYFENKINDTGFSVSLPGGENGKMALLSILKNFFRNMYKHSLPTDNNEYNGELCVKKPDDDNLQKYYYEVSLTEQTLRDKETVKKALDTIRDAFNESLINDKNEMPHKGWGVLEMKIAASYLIGLPEEYFDIDKNKITTRFLDNRIFPNKFISVNKKEINGKFQLSYTFYLIKPRLATIITDDEKLWDIKDKEHINVKKTDSEKDFKNHAQFILKEKGDSNNRTKSYNFKILYLNELKDKKDEKSQEINSLNLGKIWIEKFKSDADSYKIEYISENNYPNIETFHDKTILFDNHGSIRELKEADKIFESSYYYEAYNSNSDVGAFLRKSEDWEKKEIAFTKIAIFDERLQNDLEGMKLLPENFKNKEILEKKGIILPSFDLDSINNAKTDIERQDNIKKLLTGIKSAFSENAHYVIVHLSLLETYANIEKISLTDVYKKILKDNELEQTFKYMILTSGKGTPKTLPDKSFFINFNTLKAILRKQNKAELVKVLNSVRRIHNPQNK